MLSLSDLVFNYYVLALISHIHLTENRPKVKSRRSWAFGQYDSVALIRGF